MKKQPEDFRNPRDYEAYLIRRRGWFDFYVSFGLIFGGTAIIILTLLYGK